MNSLYEGVVYKLLKSEAQKIDPDIRVRKKDCRKLFKGTGSGQYPDIVIRFNKKTFILDTKWKIMDGTDSNNVSIHDIRQILVYNLYFNSRVAALAYPGLAYHTDWKEFNPPKTFPTYTHDFALARITLIDEEGNLTGKDLGCLLQEMFNR